VAGPDLQGLAARLDEETAELRRLLAGIDERGWSTPTPAAGWDVRDTVGHLASFDEVALRALTEPDAFRAEVAAITDVDGMVDAAVAVERSTPGPALLDRLLVARPRLVEAALAAPPGTRVPWYGPDMAVASFLTARTMETWAHGQDVADALGLDHRPTAALADVAHLCSRTMPNSFRARGLPVPDAAVHLALTGPAGERWELGAPAEGATDRIEGPAVDLCLVCTQRRHLADTALDVHGATAERWMAVAQAFAGPPGAGRAPGQFAGADR
jgi:uncharacterized protein (TIGR03084 family)